MQFGDQEILLVGDRVLIRPENPQEQTRVGLYLPQTAVEKEPVQAGRVLETGPGVAVPNYSAEHAEPWQEHREPPVRYMPVQAKPGDYALFLRKEAVEIQFRGEKLLVLPQAAILLLIRGEEDSAHLPNQGSLEEERD